ncbi:MAG: hypothetical protein M3O46_10150 [Myxococcota bacterium]|nr:hypothetical protein [Myxococcota bacterium]
MPSWAGFDWEASDTGTVADVGAAFAEDFSASMPPRYRVLFDPRTTTKHAAVCFRRGTRPAHAEVWRTLADGSAALCVVADDRPGLLSAIAASLVSHHLDVITALVFSRVVPSGQEAVDLVWVRRANSDDKEPIDDDEAASVGQVLSAILSGSISVEEIAARTPASPPSAEARMVVRFDDVDAEGLAPLFVEAPDRPGMLLAITLEVFQHGAQIVRSLVRTTGGRAFNHFDLAEFNGTSLTPERREQIRAAVYATLSLREGTGVAID